ncbi:MAG: hypothetical protein NC905_01045 [Candidatus Omnitrophica bacterium]|nr:hypothetical protein [Candidatus Omnitrophota bacterium]
MDIDEAKEFLVKIKKKDRISGAYIIFGGSSKERNECVIFLSKLLHCKETPPCDKCTDCIQIENRTHPDTKWITPSKSTLSIDDVRWVKGDIYITPYYGRRKIYIFEISYMRSEAANAFLKILEEPPSYGTLIIQSSNINFFLPTIVSRCQKIRLNYTLPEYTVPMEKIYQQFTDILGYARDKDFFRFFKAIDEFVTERDREEVEEDTGKILLLYRDIYLKKTGIPEEFLINKQIDDSFLPSNRNILDIMEKILELKGRIRYNINLKLALDNLFLHISSGF